MAAYYNEVDPFAAQWLRNLIAAGHIALGDVDERSIADVRPEDVRGYDQCHWFAGIAGWSLALRLASWPDDRPVWTGSCPCQPFSGAGQRRGAKDNRHLWPHWFRLIRERRPAILFGEQVAAAIGWGWLDAVLGDLEAEGYATGTAVLGAHSVGAPHLRQRVWFVADAGCVSAGWPATPGETQGGRPLGDAAGCGEHGLVADAHGSGRGGRPAAGGRQARDDAARGSQRLGDAGRPGLPARQRDLLSGADGDAEGGATQQPGRSPWADAIWLPCRDGKTRPTQSGLFPLAHGIPGRVGRLRAYGNAIVPALAAEFIKACRD